jgi:H+/Cl- antiporter ClcA
VPRRPLRQITEPFEAPMMPFAVGGTVVWTAAGLVLLLYREELAARGDTMWLWTCLAGVIGGLLGIVVMHIRDRRRRRRESHPTEGSLRIRRDPAQPG